MKKYDPAEEHDPLFEVNLTTSDRRTGDKMIPQTVKSVAHGKCPDCATERKVGLVRSARHLVWREHWVRTWGTSVRQCRASGALLCENPARKVSGENPPRCSCGGGAG